MADRFWRGGAGTWSTTTTNWSASSGGLGGASNPTANDDVYIDANSNTGTTAWTITFSGTNPKCRTLTVTPDAKVTFAMGTATFTVHGSWNTPATSLFGFTGTGTIVFDNLSDTGGGYITTNGVAFLATTVRFQGGNWYLDGAWTGPAAGTVFLIGTDTSLNLNGYTLTCGFFSSIVTTNRYLNFGGNNIILIGATTTVVNIYGTGFFCDCAPYQGGASGGFLRSTASVSIWSIGQSTTNFSTQTGGMVDMEYGAPNVFYNSTSAPTFNPGCVFNHLSFGAACTATSSSTQSTGLTYNGSQGIVIGGDLTLHSGGTYSGLNVTFRNLIGRVSTITTQGKTLGGVVQYIPYWYNWDVGGVTLVGNLIILSTAAIGHNLQAGVLRLNGYNLTTPRTGRSSAGPYPETPGSELPWGIEFGDNTITCNSTIGGNSLIYHPDLSNMTYTLGTGGFILTGSAGTQTVAWGTGADYATSVNITFSKTAALATITSGCNIRNFISSGTGAQVTNATILYIWGDITFNNATGTWINANLTYVGTGTQTWYNGSNNISIGAVTINSDGGTLSMANPMTLIPTSATQFGILTLTSGELRTNGQTLSIGRFYGSGSSTRRLNHGSTYIPLTSTTASATIFDLSDASGFTIQQDSGYGPGAFTRSINSVVGQQILLPTSSITTGGDSKVPSFNFTGGNSAISFGTADGQLYDLNFQTAFTGTVTGTNVAILGDLSLSSAAAANFTGLSVGFWGSTTQTVAGNGKTIGAMTSASNGATVVFTNNITCTGAITHVQGSLQVDAYVAVTCVTFSSAVSTNVRQIQTYLGGGFHINGNDTTVLALNRTGLTLYASGNFAIFFNLTYTGSVGTRTISVTNFTIADTSLVDIAISNVDINAARNIVINPAATDTVVVQGSWKNLYTVDQYSNSFGGTLSTGTGLTLYGTLSLGSTTVTADTTSALTFGATSSQTITTNGRTIRFPLTFNGAAGTWTFAGALTMTRELTIINGTVKLRSAVTSTVGSLVTSGATLKYLASSTPGSRATISDTTGTNTVTYLNIKDSAATGGATWTATSATNVDGGNNTGWTFGSAVVATGNMFLMFG